LIDDLITRGTSEPYRMFTSRAEYRLMLREDNADLRLTQIGRELGLVDDARWQAFNEYREQLELLNQSLNDNWVRPGDAAEAELNKLLPNPIAHEYRLSEMLRRPEIVIGDVAPHINPEREFSERVLEQAEINAKYAGYLSRQQDEINKALKHESTELPMDLDYALVKGLSNEVRQKLQDTRPATVGQAGRISGVTPAAISLLLVHLKRLPNMVQKSA
jgi:tRNA uridine 5-carboxymethylaminomethyl modification enzyme